jgi:protein LSM14
MRAGRGGPSNTAATRPAAGEKLKFDTDFDWTATNAQFESELKAITEVLDKKVKVSTRAHQPEDDNDDEVEDLDAVSTGKGTGAPPPQDENACYDKTKSFFDKISCEALEREEG